MTYFNNMPPNLESGLKLLFNFVYSFSEFVLKLFYIVILFVGNIITYLISCLIQYVPLLFRAFSAVLSFTFWISTRLLQGILGIGDKTTNTLSWLIVLCAFYLYFDHKGYVFRGPHSEQAPASADRERARTTPRYSDRRPASNVQRSPTRDRHGARQRIIQNIIEQLNSSVADVQRVEPRQSGDIHEHQAPDDTDDEHEVENQENENEANSQEEAERMRMQDDNSNNSRREWNDDDEAAATGDANHGNADTALCIVCLDRVRNAAVFPCGHTHLCLTCVQRLCRENGPCPMCQKHIEEYRQIFV